MKTTKRIVRKISLTIDSDILAEMIERKKDKGIPISRQFEIAYKEWKKMKEDKT